MTESLPQIAFDRNLVIVGLEAGTADESIRALGRRFVAEGHVREGYIDAVIKREHEFATGLPTAIPVALPHAEASNVL
ncbi:MAG TPA: PTS sugar transporter subunit IIA, partial [Bacillota bacterium]